MQSRPPTTKPKAENLDVSFKFGPLRGRPEFFYEHVPICQEDPNCFRSTCGYCHPRRDSQSTPWSWVYPLEQSKSRTESKPRAAVPPLLFGKHFDLEPGVLTRDPSLPEEAFLLPNFDFLDVDSPQHNPWGFTSTDLKGEVDGPSLRKSDSEKSLNKNKIRKRINSSLRLDAQPFLPRGSPGSSPTKNPPPRTERISSDEVKLTQSSSLPEKKPIIETPPQLEVDAFLRRMEAIKMAAVKPPATLLPSAEPPKVAVAVAAEPPKVTESAEVPKVAAELPKVTEVPKVPEVANFLETLEKKQSAQISKSSKSKAIPMVPPFKSKITTHTRTEQESLMPSLPLRGGSSTSTPVIVEAQTEKVKTLTVSHAEVDQDDTQSIDTGAKAPHRQGWFLVLYAFICSWLCELGQDVKELLQVLWASIILHLPFFKSSAPSRPTKAKPTRSTQLKKPLPPQRILKPIPSRGLKSEINDGSNRK